MADPILNDFPMHIVMIPVHRDVPKLIRNIGVVFNNASTNVQECGHIRVLPVNDETEVAEVGVDPASLCI